MLEKSDAVKGISASLDIVNKNKRLSAYAGCVHALMSYVYKNGVPRSMDEDVKLTSLLEDIIYEINELAIIDMIAFRSMVKRYKTIFKYISSGDDVPGASSLTEALGIDNLFGEGITDIINDNMYEYRNGFFATKNYLKERSDVDGETP